MYIALKHCKFGGNAYNKGDEVPAEVVLDTAAPHLIRRGVIAEAGNAGPLLPAAVSIETMPVPFMADEGEVMYEMSVADVQEGLRAIQKTDADLIKYMESIKSEDVLIFIDVVKGAMPEIHEAAEARAKALKAEELMKLKKEQLAEMATELGMEVTDEHTKKDMVAYILENKAGSDA